MDGEGRFIMTLLGSMGAFLLMLMLLAFAATWIDTNQQQGRYNVCIEADKQWVDGSCIE